MFSGMAPEFTGTKASSDLLLSLWMVLAKNSLPEPDSPVMRMVLVVGAILYKVFKILRISGVSPKRLSSKWSSMRRESDFWRNLEANFLTFDSKTSMDIGFKR